MKKLILSSVLLSGILLSGAVISQADASTANTDLNITVKPDDGHEETGGPYKGKLAIVHKPTAFNFVGTATADQLILSNSSSKPDNQYISVYDDRETGAGKWKLDGQLSKIDKLDENGDPIDRDATADQTTDLQGSLVITTGSIYDYNIGTTEKTVNGVTDWDPADVQTTTPAPATVKTGAGGETTLTLAAGATTATPILTSTATAKNGAATNLGNAKFIIQAGSAVNSTSNDFKYHGVITWTVANNA